MSNSHKKIRNGENTSAVLCLQDFQKAIFRSRYKHRDGWPCVVYACWSFWVSNDGLSTWKKRQIQCSHVSLLPFERTTIKLGDNMQRTCLFSSECSLEKDLRYLNNVCILFFLIKGTVNEVTETHFMTLLWLPQQSTFLQEMISLIWFHQYNFKNNLIKTLIKPNRFQLNIC